MIEPALLKTGYKTYSLTSLMNAIVSFLRNKSRDKLKLLSLITATAGLFYMFCRENAFLYFPFIFFTFFIIPCMCVYTSKHLCAIRIELNRAEGNKSGW